MVQGLYNFLSGLFKMSNTFPNFFSLNLSASHEFNVNLLFTRILCNLNYAFLFLVFK